MTSFLLMILLFLIGMAAGCVGVLYDGPPEDLCFEGLYSVELFSLDMRYNRGTVIAAVIKEQSPDDPWEGMSFVGKVVRQGRAEGVLSLNFHDNSVQEFNNYSINLEPSSGECNMRNQLVFPPHDYNFDGRRYSLAYTLSRRP